MINFLGYNPNLQLI